MSVYIDPKDLIIGPNSNQSSAIYVRAQQGLYQRIRRYLAFFLMTLFVVLPWISIDGKQSILLDVANQQMHIFGTTLFPQDFPVIAGLLMVAAFGLFFLTSWLGRVWCGFLCPQTHWLFIFIWLEEKIEGTRNQRMMLDKKPLSAAKIGKKTLKHASWGVVAFLTGTTFISYFVPPVVLYVDLFFLSWSGLVTFWVMLFAVCTYGNAGWLKEKMCLHMCPYARFQSAMFDRDTLIVAYDVERGESRGPRKRKDDPKALGIGDCVDCNLCVEVCPTGIDIRHGLQYECINCGACADACDQTMSKFNYQPGLISFTSEAQLGGGTTNLFRPKIIGYGIISVLIIISMAVYWNARIPVELTVLRDRNVLYRINNDDFIENSYQLKLLNKSAESKDYRIVAGGITDVKNSLTEVVTVKSGELASLIMTVTADPINLPRRVLPIELKIVDNESNTELVVYESKFYSE